MISAKLNGGLGNQMFQIAAAYALALESNDVCAFDFSVEVKNQGNNPIMYRNNIFSKLAELPGGWKPTKVYTEPHYEYQPIPYHEGVLLKGYFGREEYFKKHKTAISNLFTDEVLLDLCYQIFPVPLAHGNAFLHVRRGDYLKFDRVYYVKDNDYYGRAIDFLDTRVPLNKILVFSDDIQWCKENLTDKRMVFVEDNPDYVDLYLMAMCDYAIMGNSTFSWWAAWLGDIETVVVPSKWFKEPNLNSESIVPKRWNRI